MNKRGKRLLLTTLLFAVLLIFILAIQISKRTIYNDTSVIGNTAGNLYNTGLFCESGDLIYFSNPLDDGTLYSMNLDTTNIQKINEDKVRFINADPNYLYYSRVNHKKEATSNSLFAFYNTGLYRLTKENGKLLTLETNPCGLISLSGNTLFYQLYSIKTAIQLYSTSIDGSKETLLSPTAILPASIHQGKLYYAGVTTDHAMYAMDVESKKSSMIFDGNYMMPLVLNDTIYYISLEDNYALCKSNLDGSDKTILVDEFCSTYNITNDSRYLFYQVDGGANNRIEYLDLVTKETTTLLSGNYKQIHVTSNYVFFNDYEETTSFKIDLTTMKLSTFEPRSANQY